MCRREKAELACRCEGETILLGDKCALKHFKENKQHELINFELALVITKDAKTEIVNGFRLQKYLKLHKELSIYKSQLKTYKQSVLGFKEKITQLLHSTTDKTLEMLAHAENQVLSTIQALDSHMLNPTEASQKLLQTIMKSSLSKYLTAYPHNFLILEDEVSAAISTMYYSGASKYTKRQDVLQNLKHEISARDTIIRQTKMELIEKSYEVHKLWRLVNDRDRVRSYTREPVSSWKDEPDLSKIEALIKRRREEDLEEAMPRTILISRKVANSDGFEPDSDAFTEKERSPDRYGGICSSLDRFSASDESRGLDFSLSDLDPLHRYIYIAKQNSKVLIQYDSYDDVCEGFDVSACVIDEFVNTSTCLLPNGDVFIAGGESGDKFVANAYIYKVQNSECIQLASLRNPRAFIGLCYFKSKVYAFGGEDLLSSVPTAECYNLNSEKWEILPDMHESRTAPSCISKEDMIYIFSGNSSCSIEVFNSFSNTFILTGILTDSFNTVAFSKDEKIYLICEKDIKILNSELEILECKDNYWNVYYDNLSNIIVRGEYAIFYNHIEKCVEKYNVSKQKIATFQDILF